MPVSLSVSIYIVFWNSKADYNNHGVLDREIQKNKLALRLRFFQITKGFQHICPLLCIFTVRVYRFACKQFDSALANPDLASVRFLLISLLSLQLPTRR